MKNTNWSNQLGWYYYTPRATMRQCDYGKFPVLTMSKLLYFFCFSAKRCANSLKKSGKAGENPRKNLRLEPIGQTAGQVAKQRLSRRIFQRKRKLVQPVEAEEVPPCPGWRAAGVSGDCRYSICLL